LVATIVEARGLLLAFLYVPAVALGQVAAPVPIVLSIDETASATQRAEEKVTYSFAARAGESYLIEVEQRGLDLIVTAQNPDGTALSYNSPLRRDELEHLVLDAATTGEYRITIESKELTNAVGGHSIRISTFADVGNRAQAWRLMTAAAATNAEADRARLSQTVAQEQVDTLKQASHDAYARARDIWQELGESRLYARTLYSMAMLEYMDLYDWPGAADMAAMAEIAYRDVDDGLRVRAHYLHACASVDAATEIGGEGAEPVFETALVSLAQIAALYEQWGDVHGLAETLNFAGYTHHLRGNFVDATSAWQRSASLFSENGAWREELNVRQNLAVIDVDEGYLGKAIAAFTYILEQIPAAKDPEFEAQVLTNLGAAHRDFGNIDEALQAYSAALQLRQKLGEATHISASLRGLGSTYYVAGDYERAQSYLQRALEAARAVGDGRSQAAILTYLGNIAFLGSDYDAALALHRDAERLTNSDHGRAVRRLLIGKDLLVAGHPSEALAISEEVLASSVDSPVVVADAHTQIGRSRLALGEYEAAADQLQQALSLYRSLRLQEGEADALNGLALAEQGMGRVTEALTYGEAALDRIENLRVRVSVPELRALYSATQRSLYETQIELLAPSDAQATDEAKLAALGVSERARARMLVDLLADARVDTLEAVSEESRSTRNRLYDELSARSYQRDRLLALTSADAAAKKQLDELLREIVTLENELTLLDTRAHTDSAVPSTVLTGQGIQSLIEPNTVLVQYQLGQRRSFAWVVRRDSIGVVELAPRDVIEAAVRDARSNLQTSTSAPAPRNAELQALADHVLTPLAQLIDGERVLVAADGPLHYVPFAVLPVIRDGVSVPLIATHEVVSVPSMSALAAHRARRSTEVPGKTLAIFADPVFERTDERLAQPRATPTNTLGDEPTTRSSFDLRRLPYSGREARDIAALVPDTDRLVREGFGASRMEVLDTNLKQYRYLHFATHGLVDSRYPALSALALSQFDERGNPSAGLLRLDDIYDLELNADLVVLSACGTALGREIRGEGLVGLTQGFLRAGAKGLVLGLWQVSDAATAVLMTRFYEHLIKEGVSAGEALRAAQLSMAAERRWASPYYWGAFVLVGDVR
jgi:CHAT domain-containing protein